MSVILCIIMQTNGPAEPGFYGLTSRHPGYHPHCLP